MLEVVIKLMGMSNTRKSDDAYADDSLGNSRSHACAARVAPLVSMARTLQRTVCLFGSNR